MAYDNTEQAATMIIVETTIFTRRVLKLLTEEEYRQLQILLVEFPDTGKVIKDSGGLRKMRWSMAGIGKRRRSTDHILLGSPKKHSINAVDLCQERTG